MYKINKETVVVDAIKASIENHEWCRKNEEQHKNTFYKLKYIVWYLMLILVSPHKSNHSNKMVCAMTPVNEKRLREYAKNSGIIRFAKLNSSLDKMRCNYSVLSPYSLPERFLILKEAISFYIKHRKVINGYLHFTLEYYSIARYVLNNKITEIISPCMYDRYCTFLSYLAYGNNIRSLGVQDGAAIDIGVPRKVYCTQMYCFDEFEETVIRRFIMNNDCKYIQTGFKSMLSWCNFDKKDKFTIGIASQDWYTSKTIELLDNILYRCNADKYTIIVFPHYRENVDQYDSLKSKYPDLLIKTGDRYKNIDLLVTFYSTIVYDYWAVNPGLHVKCLEINGYKPSYYDRKNVTVYKDIESLVDSMSSLEKPMKT